MMAIEGESLNHSTGTLHYGRDNIILVVDPEIYRYYRSLIPPWITTNSQMYPAHISVVRKETPLNVTPWKRYEGEQVGFWYSNIIHFGNVYVWLNVFSTRLESIRMELGLSVDNSYPLLYKIPSWANRCYHITLGNLKGMTTSTPLLEEGNQRV